MSQKKTSEANHGSQFQKKKLGTKVMRHGQHPKPKVEKLYTALGHVNLRELL
jgi:hypothetical protein